MNDSHRIPSPSRTFWLGAARRATTVAFVACLLLLGSAASAQEPLYRPLSSELSSDPDRTRLDIAVDREHLLGDPSELTLLTPQGTTIEAERVHSEVQGPGRFYWHGSVVGDEIAGTVVLTLWDGVLYGRFGLEGRSFQIEPRGASANAPAPAHTVSEVSAAAAPAVCGGAVRPSIELGGIEKSDDLIGGPLKNNPRIDVLILYTPAAAAEAGAANMQALAASGINYLNASLANSMVSGRARLVGVEAAPWLNNFSSQSEALPGIRTDPQVIARRNAYRADFVVLFMGSNEGSDVCGLGYVLTRGISAAAMGPWAFSTVRIIGCAVDVTTAHEIGHNLGLNHNPADAGIPPHEAFQVWAYGHFMGGVPFFKTVMSYGPFTDYPYFSHPGKLINGEPAGIAGERDNAQSLGLTMQMGSNYFQTGGGGGGGNSSDTPSNLTATDLTNSTFTLAFQDNSSNETGFEIQRRMGSGAWSLIGTVDANVTIFFVTGLSPSTSYGFRVRAVLPTGYSNYSGRLDITTLGGPPLPESLTASPLTTSSILLEWEPGAATSTIHVEARAPGQAAGEYTAMGTANAALGQMALAGLEESHPYTLRVYATDPDGSSPMSAPIAATTLTRTGPCVADGNTLCLLGDRFEASAYWSNQYDENVANAPADRVLVPGSDETGMFTFFDAARTELVVKALDGRVFNDMFWVFYASLSDIEYWITVRDTIEETTRTYYNDPGDLCGEADTNAFAEGPEALLSGPTPLRTRIPGTKRFIPGDLSLGDPASVASATGTCVADDETICFLDNRFSLSVTYETAQGETGTGKRLPAIETSEAGFFWFFSAGNLELGVKFLDGRGSNGNFWVFWGGVSDVAYELTVTDTMTGNTAIYNNELGEICGGADINALPGS